MDYTWIEYDTGNLACVFTKLKSLSLSSEFENGFFFFNAIIMTYDD